MIYEIKEVERRYGYQIAAHQRYCIGRRAYELQGKDVLKMNATDLADNFGVGMKSTYNYNDVEEVAREVLQSN